MALKQGYCPACEQHVEWQAIPSAMGMLYKCSNCWHHLNGGAIAKLDALTEQLAKLAKQRKDLLEAHTG